MNPGFYGTIEKADTSGDPVIVRCIREFFHDDGLMADDIWIWEVANLKSTKQLQSLTGRMCSGFEVCDHPDGQSLRIWLDDGDEEVVLVGSSVSKKEESRDLHDLQQLVVELADRVRRDELEQLALSRKLSGVVTSIHQKIDRLQRREEFEKQRASAGAPAIAREIEDLNAILRRLEEPNP